MRKFLLLSVVFASICFPIVAARDKSAARALKKTFVLIIGFNLFYLLAIQFLYNYLPW